MRFVMQPTGAMLVRVLANDYPDQTCSIAAALEVVGERWSLLIVRDVLLGLRRFDQLQADLGIARNILGTRLQRLVEHGVLEKRRYQERPERYEYRLTEKGLDLWPAIVALMSWGDKYGAPAGPPTVIEHRDCGGLVDDRRCCTLCGAALGPREVIARLGPGAGPDHPLRRRSGRPATGAHEPGGDRLTGT